MKRTAVFLLTMCVLAAGCDEDNDPGPSNPGTQPLVFTATLSAQNEVPPVSNAESTATGSATVTMTPTRDAAGTITGGTFEFQFNVSGLTNASNITLAHIHQAAAGSNGGIVVNSELSAATAIPTPLGTASFSRAGLTPTAPSIPAAIVANPAGFYFNIHTSQNPGGVVRGQLVAR